MGIVLHDYQTTVKTRASLTGTGVHSGKEVSISFLPADADTGIVFQLSNSGESREFRALVSEVGATDLCTMLGDPAGEHIGTVEHLMAAVFGLGVESKIAIGEIRTMQDAAETEWAEYWGAVIDVPDRHGGTYRLHGRPWRFSSDTLDAPSAPAFRGEHNADVFAELGMSMSEIDALVEAGALVEHPHQRPSVESHVSPATLAADAAAGTVAACAQ